MKAVEQAIQYAEMGWSVLEVFGVNDQRQCACGKLKCNQGKHPRTRRGVRGATINHDKIKDWFTRHPNSNIGIAAGDASNLIVLDVDPRNGGTNSFDQLESIHGDLRANTLIARTGGGGFHVYFEHPGLPIKSGSKLLGQGIDYQSNGKYVVAPHSRHYSGNHYEWENWGAKPSKMPATLIELLTSVNGDPEQLPSKIYQGGRNTLLHCFASSLRGKGLEYSEILERVKSENLTRCWPRLPDEEIQQITQSASKYQKGYNGFINEWRSQVFSEHGPPEATTRSLLMALSMYANSERIAHPSLLTLAGSAAVTEKTASTHLRKATESGWIDRYRSGNQGGQGWHYEYLLTLPIRCLPFIDHKQHTGIS